MVSSFSVVIPCKNEERYISLCVNSLLAQKMDGYNLEIIVVDNGSTDHTAEILKRFSKKIVVHIKPDISIPEVRNYGAERSSGEWIAFVDADVEVDACWLRQIENTLRKLQDRDIDITKAVIGSTCSVPNNPTWVERIWFDQLQQRDMLSTRYVNGANMVMHRSLYNSVGGFDAKYTTGEDEKFCEDARKAGGIIFKDNSIKTIHHGYPKTIIDFFRRERWHGQGMSQYLSNPWKSKDLSLSLYFLIILLTIPARLIIYRGILINIFITFFAMLAPLMVFSFFRSEKKLRKAIPLSVLYFIYGCARLCSILDIMRCSSGAKKRFKDTTSL